MDSSRMHKVLFLFAFWLGMVKGAFVARNTSPITPDYIRNKHLSSTSANNKSGGVATTSIHTIASSSSSSSLHSSSHSINDNDSNIERVDVVLFGVGDLRTDDHIGLINAMKEASKNPSTTRVIPLVILDQDTTPNIPGAIDHTFDTATLLSASLSSLQQNLMDQLGLELHIQMNKGQGFLRSLNEVLDQITTTASSSSAGSLQTHLHVCDLGDADNSMGYGPFSCLKEKFDDDACWSGNNNSPDVKLHEWSCPLREEPWKDIPNVPELYTDYTKTFVTDPLPPLSTPKPVKDDDHAIGMALCDGGDSLTTVVPSSSDICDFLQETLHLDKERIQCEENTGLFGTHWGGLDAITIGENNVRKCVKSFVGDCLEEDDRWVVHRDYPGKSIRRNPNSLEHATLSWMQGVEGTENGDMQTNNLIAGESMTRYLAAPLTFGTVSSRRLYHSSKKSSLFHTSPLRTLVEGREWHKILAARNIRTDPAYHQGGGSCIMNTNETQYGYWRWHGFLCRYLKQNLTCKGESRNSNTVTTTVSDDAKEAIVLVHGFGASGAQWSKCFQEISTSIKLPSSSNETTKKEVVGLAPDLLGFGHSEKPPLSYTQYLWQSFVLSFAKEIAMKRYQIPAFTVGGNSIGGYTSISTAADDTVLVGESFWTGSGAPGSGGCTGVVLMNSAGQIQSKEDIATMKQQQEQQGDSSVKLRTVAELTATNGLPPCSPPPRPVARVFGNGLLGYLRPRIQSICVNLYPTNPDAVNDILCKGINRDSLDPGAINVMISGSKLPPPRTMNELINANFGSAESEGCPVVREGTWKGPLLVAQGMLDPLNDAKARASMLGDMRAGVTVSPINGGHCPHDELPQDVALAMTQWLYNQSDEGGVWKEEMTAFQVDTPPPSQVSSN